MIKGQVQQLTDNYIYWVKISLISIYIGLVLKIKENVLWPWHKSTFYYIAGTYKSCTQYITRSSSNSIIDDFSL